MSFIQKSPSQAAKEGITGESGTDEEEYDQHANANHGLDFEFEAYENCDGELLPNSN